MEQRAAEILAERDPGDLAISLSHEIGRVGFLERENASIMNACLADLSAKVVNSFRRALKELVDRGALLHQPERRNADDARAMSSAIRC